MPHVNLYFSTGTIYYHYYKIITDKHLNELMESKIHISKKLVCKLWYQQCTFSKSANCSE